MPSRGDAPKISFFAFQDIITCITGIMFLVVFMLIVAIAESKVEVTEAPADPEASARSDSNVRELEETVGKLRSDLAESSDWLEKNAARIGELAKMDLSQIPETLSKTEAALADLKKKLAAVERAAQDIARNSEDEARKAAAAKDALKDALSARPALENERDSKEKKLSEIKKALESSQKALSIAVERHESKNPVIVECGPSGIRCKTLSPPAEFDFREPDALTHAETTARFLEWAKTRDRASEYFILAVMPAAFNYAAVLETELKSAGFERGKEVLPDNDTTLFTPGAGGPSK
jgi:hypothetical protein